MTSIKSVILCVLKKCKHFAEPENIACKVSNFYFCRKIQMPLPDLQMLKKSVKQAVDIYNNQRVHWSLELRTPQKVHQSYNSLKYKSYSKKQHNNLC
ncbi:MAG: hypothetical protein FWD66_08350 [Paludibacter sp.]|nr:hypothetical protein [Paludibacter sp.]